MSRAAAQLLPDFVRDLEAVLPPMVPLHEAAKAVCRHPRTLSREAARGKLVVLAGDGQGCSVVPRSSLLEWVASWPRARA